MYIHLNMKKKKITKTSEPSEKEQRALCFLINKRPAVVTYIYIKQFKRKKKNCSCQGNFLEFYLMWLSLHEELTQAADASATREVK